MNVNGARARCGWKGAFHDLAGNEPCSHFLTIESDHEVLMEAASPELFLEFIIEVG